jgi:hypothetical protein
MPYKSEAQRAYFNANKEKIGEKTVDEFNKSSQGLSLPKVATPKVKSPKVKMPTVSPVVNPIKKALPEEQAHKASEPLTGLDKLRKKVKAKLSDLE